MPGLAGDARPGAQPVLVLVVRRGGTGNGGRGEPCRGAMYAGGEEQRVRIKRRGLTFMSQISRGATSPW